ncbi:hypothetical protein VTN77DRAFT_3516 [Rasamsonia byssochlamydoides]|uniref:uncharacterized protein n=1 Tax=Rasamsonia byssochlamydoides TaxID=89139 RepID=UPI003742A1DC
MQSLILALSFVASATALAIQQPLRFTKDGTFQLSVFSDLHYGEAENLVWGPQQDVNSTRVMNTILDVEHPQLVVINGDLITGENTYRENSSWYVDEIVAPLVERGLLWASTYGNHDSDYNLSRAEIFAREKRYPNSLTQNMVPGFNAGVSNYYLPVFSSDVQKQAPEVILWFFDSRGGNYFEELDSNGQKVPQPGWVDESVADWFLRTNAELTKQYGKVIPSLAFYHIPVDAMLAFQQGPGVDPHREPGINDDNPLAQQTGSTYEGQDVPFMKALLATEGLIATFSGHDHGDDWCYKWKTTLPGMNLTGNGLFLCFGRHSGYGGYGTWTRGARQILLDERTLGSQTKTWIRLEDGTISGSVTLNATYGQDYYPAVADTST